MHLIHRPSVCGSLVRERSIHGRLLHGRLLHGRSLYGRSLQSWATVAAVGLGTAMGCVSFGQGGAIAALPVALVANASAENSAQPSNPLDTVRYWQRRTVWRTVEVPEGEFSVLMPAQPRLRRRSTHDNAQYITAVQQSYGALYMVGWSAGVPASADPRKAESSKSPEKYLGSQENRDPQAALQLSAEREALLSRFGGQILQEEPIYLNDHPGQYYQLLSQIGDETYVITHQAYWIGDRLYQMTVAVPQRRSPGFVGIAEGFMRSFQLL